MGNYYNSFKAQNTVEENQKFFLKDLTTGLCRQEAQKIEENQSY